MLKHIVIAQGIWLLLAVIYNLISILKLSNGEPALAGSAPFITLLLLSVYFLPLITGWKENSILHFIFAFPLTIALLYIGVWKHLDAFFFKENLDNYSSFQAWVWAICINIYGCMSLSAGIIFSIINLKNNS